MLLFYISVFIVFYVFLSTSFYYLLCFYSFKYSTFVFNSFLKLCLNLMFSALFQFQVFLQYFMNKVDDDEEDSSAKTINYPLNDRMGPFLSQMIFLYSVG